MPFRIWLKLITIDFGATLDFKDFPKVKIKDIVLLDVFVVDSDVSATDSF